MYEFFRLIIYISLFIILLTILFYFFK
jgi:hypothetical protein